MSRARTLSVAIVPSLLATGFLFSSQAGHAETGRGGPRAWSSSDGSVIIVQADPRPSARGRQRPPVPPAAPAPPVPPPPPSPPPHIPGSTRGMSISIRDGKIEIEGIAEMVSNQLEGVLRALDSMPNVDRDARDRVKNRVKAVRAKIKARLHRLKSMDLDKVGAEVERIGDEIEREMEGVDKDLEKLGEKLNKHLAEKLAKDLRDPWARAQPGPDHSDDSDGEDDEDDEDGDDVVPPSIDIDPSDLQDRMAALKTLKLTAEQKQKLARLRAESEQKVANAKREIEQTSSRLRDSLGDRSAKESEIERQIEKLSQHEATMRKARLLTWIKVRNILSEDQIRLIEAGTRRQ